MVARRLGQQLDLASGGAGVGAGGVGLEVTPVGVAIAALNGSIRSEIDASGILPASERGEMSREAILNGIAYDPSNQTFLLTGKLWPKLLRVRFVPAL